MSINIYLILLIVLLVFNFLIWALVIWFRVFCDVDCCGRRNASQSSARNLERSEGGHGNLAFDDEEGPNTPPRPFSVTERMESPPSYEDAIKQELYRFQLPAVPNNDSLENQRSIVWNTPCPGEGTAAAPRTSDGSSTSAAPSYLEQLISQQNTPSTSSDSISRPRCSSSGSCLTTQLSTISEEVDDERPMTLVIDCIGVQAARLLDTCDTSVQLTSGGELDKHSQC